jgi:hypothetical protein
MRETDVTQSGRNWDEFKILEKPQQMPTMMKQQFVADELLITLSSG